MQAAAAPRRISPGGPSLIALGSLTAPLPSRSAIVSDAHARQAPGARLCAAGPCRGATVAATGPSSAQPVRGRHTAEPAASDRPSLWKLVRREWKEPSRRPARPARFRRHYDALRQPQYRKLRILALFVGPLLTVGQHGRGISSPARASSSSCSALRSWAASRRKLARWLDRGEPPVRRVDGAPARSHAGSGSSPARDGCSAGMSGSYAHGPSAVPLLGETIGENLRRTVERHGDREALVVRSQGYRATYRELWEHDRRGGARACSPAASAAATASASGRRTASSGSSPSTPPPASARSWSTSTRPTRPPSWSTP